VILIYFYALIADLKSVLQYHLNIRGTDTFILEIACGWLDFRRGYADSPKLKLINPSVLWNFEGFREEETAFVPNVP
jgi:hypothetical protein